jgi:hypothetical protein
VSKGGVDDWDKAASFGGDATPRRSTSSLDPLMRLAVLVVLAVSLHSLILTGCDQSKSGTAVTKSKVTIRIPSDPELEPAAQVLANSLRKLNLMNPIADLDGDIQRGDPSFVGINGYTCFAPGIDNFGGTTDDQKLASSHPTHCMEGTGDVLSGQLISLQKIAEDYAFTYNRELLRRIRAGLVK